MFAKAMFGPPKTHFWVNFLYLLLSPSLLLFIIKLSFISFWPQSHQFISFRPLFGQITILSLSFVTFRVSHFHVSHLTHETFKLSLQNTLNMSKTTRVYFGVLQRATDLVFATRVDGWSLVSWRCWRLEIIRSPR